MVVALQEVLIGATLGFAGRTIAAEVVLPNDEAALKAQGYVGVPIMATASKDVIGHLAVLDNRPLNFEEWEGRANQLVFVSATPGPYELRRAGGAVVRAGP